MDRMFADNFVLKADASACTSVISGSDINVTEDIWYYCDMQFESKKIYALVSEYGMGCEYLAFLMGGLTEAENGLKIYCGDEIVNSSILKKAAFRLDPDISEYGGKPVRKTLEKALAQNDPGLTFEDIAKRFLLTPERWDRKFSQCGNEGARAMAALGYAMGKKIFYTGYHPSSYYNARIDSMWLVALKELTDSGAVVLLPAGSDTVLRHFADEVIYLRQSPKIENFDISEKLAAYSEVTDRKDIFKL